MGEPEREGPEHWDLSKPKNSKTRKSQNLSKFQTKDLADVDEERGADHRHVESDRGRCPCSDIWGRGKMPLS